MGWNQLGLSSRKTVPHLARGQQNMHGEDKRSEGKHISEAVKGIVTTVPLSVSYGGAKPLGPWVRTSNFVPWWVTGRSREGSTRAQKHRTVVC